jgi:sulfite reductase (NADPH) flavoprotein alpha-component
LGLILETGMITTPRPALTIVFGSQTGNGKRLAEQLHASAKASGLSVELFSAREVPARQLQTATYLALIVSTHGDGEPPDDAKKLMEDLSGRRAPDLKGVAYAVLALGDSSYPRFCETGRQADELLQLRGATRSLNRVDCDVDFQKKAAQWVGSVLKEAAALAGQPRLEVVLQAPKLEVTSQYDRERPYTAPVLENLRITGRNASKAVHHLEIGLEGSGLTYEPGDALGVWHENPSAIVDQVLTALRRAGSSVELDEPVTVEDETHTTYQWLAQHREITRLTRPFLASHAKLAKSSELSALLEPGQEQGFRDLMKRHQLVDVLLRYPATWEGESFIRALRPLTPRLYSIASSQATVGDEVHLTVAQVVYEAADFNRLGAASSHLVRAPEQVRVFVEPNERFRLPMDPDRDIIMIGPGTGVAPFRGFLQHRQAQGARGRNWLFFGARSFREEFLYQVEWIEALKKGVLHQFGLAISRDRSRPKQYVQDCVKEQGQTLFDWLEKGAYVYVCGDAEHMAGDVDKALISVIANDGGRSLEKAQAYIEQLRRDGRYLRDVY